MKSLLTKFFDLFRTKKEETTPLRIQTFEESVSDVVERHAKYDNPATEVWAVKGTPKAEKSFSEIVDETNNDMARMKEIERAITESRIKSQRTRQETPRRSVDSKTSRSDDTALMSAPYWAGSYSDSGSSRGHSDSNHHSSPSHSNDCSPSDSGSSGSCD